jgi:hypothetical protein
MLPAPERDRSPEDPPRRGLFFIAFLVVVVLIVVCVVTLPRAWGLVALTLLTWLATLVSIGTWVWDRSHAGRLLFELGRLPFSKWALAAAALAALGFLLSVATRVSTGEALDIPVLAQILIGLAVVTQQGFFYRWGSRVEIRERGPLALRLLRWEDVRAWRWEGDSKAGSELTLFRRRPWFWMTATRLHVGPEHKDAVEALVNANVGAPASRG